MVKLKYRCPICWQVWRVGQKMVKEGFEVEMCCHRCHEVRVSKQQAKDNQFVTDLPPVQNHPYSAPPMVLVNYSITHTGGRRVIRKSEPMGG